MVSSKYMHILATLSEISRLYICMCVCVCLRMYVHAYVHFLEELMNLEMSGNYEKSFREKKQCRNNVDSVYTCMKVADITTN